MMSKEKKQVYINEMSSQLDKAEAVIVAHYQGLTVKQLDELRKKMRELWDTSLKLRKIE